MLISVREDILKNSEGDKGLGNAERKDLVYGEEVTPISPAFICVRETSKGGGISEEGAEKSEVLF